MLGPYVCYNEKETGNFENAVTIANKGYLIWRHPVSINRPLKFPTKIIIKISGEERYYRGDLLLVREYAAFNPSIFDDYVKHRPPVWKNGPEKEWKSVLFISNLETTTDPPEVRGMHPPQAVIYVNFNN
jgi:hypothetical protein